MSENTAGHHRVINIGKKITIPDVGERTDNDPCYLMSSNDVLKLLNQIRGERNNKAAETGIGMTHSVLEKKDISYETVCGVIGEAKSLGWAEVRQYGKQLLFIK